MRLHGSDFIALRSLSNRANLTLAEPGEPCDRVPPGSLPALYASGKIQPIVTDVPVRAERVRRFRQAKESS